MAGTHAEPWGLDRIIAECAVRRAEPGFIDLCTGTSAFDFTQFVDLDIPRERLTDTLGYGSPEGQGELREALSRLYCQVLDVEVPPQRIVITDGATSALHVAFLATLGVGDEVIVPSVGFPVFRSLAHMVGARCVIAPVDDRMLYDVTRLRQLVTPRTRAIVVNTPSNPTMSALDPDELAQLLALGPWVICDEVYSLVAHGDRPTSVLTQSHSCFVVNSLSKSHGAPGLRVGYVVVPEDHIEIARTIRANLSVCNSLPAQLLARQLLAANDQMLSSHRTYLRAQYAAFRALCDAAGIKILGQPSAGFFCAVDASGRATQSTMDLALALLQHEGIGVCPSADFGEPDAGFLRLNYSVPLARLQSAVPRIARYLGGSG